MEITKTMLGDLKDAMSNARSLEYDEQYSVQYIPLTTVQNKVFEQLYHTASDIEFKSALGYLKKDIIIFGAADVNTDKYDANTEYAGNINFYLDQVLPSVYRADIQRKMYACFCTFRVSKGVEYFEPSLFSSWNCLRIALNNPECIVCIKTKKTK